MSTLAEIENAAEKLSASEQEELLRFLTAKLAQTRQKKAAPKPYRTRTHPGGYLPGIDGDKIGQLVDDL
jgi:hypothetical protein